MKKFTPLLFAVLLLLASCAKDPNLTTPETPRNNELSVMTYKN